MSNESVDGDSNDDYGRGGLTPTDRTFLRMSDSERRAEYSRQARSAARSRIRDRVRASLHDFRLLTDHLDDEERDTIFAAEPGTAEHAELSQDVMNAVELLYTGMGGESAFRRPLKHGVANGEAALGNVDHALSVAPQFTLHRTYRADGREITDLIEAGDWDRLYPPDLFSFIRLAVAADAIDFPTIRERLDRREQAQKWTAQFHDDERKDP